MLVSCLFYDKLCVFCNIRKLTLLYTEKSLKILKWQVKESIFPIQLESRAEAHIVVVVDVVAAEVAADEDRVPSVLRRVLRRRPVVVRKALVRVVRGRYA